MAYQHDKYTVAKLEKHTQEFISRLANQVSTHNEDDPVPTMVDGLPLSTACAEMVKAVREFMPDIKIGLGGSGGDYDTYAKGLASVFVYREGDVYGMGRIGFRDVAINGYKHHYFVYSRKISNQKCHPSRWQYYTKSSEDMGKALKQVKKFLIPYSPTEIASRTAEDFAETLARRRRNAHSDMRQAWRVIVNDNETQLLEEIKHLIKVGHQFLKPQFAERVAAYLSSEGAYTQEVDCRLDAYFMNVGEDTTEIVEYENMVDGDGYSNIRTAPKTTNTVATQDIPFDLQMKIASLQVAEPMHYIEGLGMRVGDRTFWVQR